MSNKTITDYSSASGIDPVNDYLLIESLNVYYKINRNTIMGVTGTPADISSSQSFSNKTLDNTNAITIKDSSFTLENASDTTKKAVFSLASITAGTTRTITLPNSSSTLATLTGTESLTNKTITGATISGGTIDNATVTVDSIAGHTSSTIVTVANLQISNGVLNSSNAVTATSIAAGAIQPQALVAGTGSGWGWQSWTPTFTNVTGGTLNYANYIQIGKSVFFRLKYTLSGAGVSGAIIFTTPTTMNSAYSSTADIVIGQAVLQQSGVGSYVGIPVANSTTTIQVFASNASATYTFWSTTTSTIPFTWANTHLFTVSGVYEGA